MDYVSYAIVAAYGLCALTLIWGAVKGDYAGLD